MWKFCLPMAVCIGQSFTQCAGSRRWTAWLRFGRSSSRSNTWHNLFIPWFVVQHAPCRWMKTQSGIFRIRFAWLYKYKVSIQSEIGCFIWQFLQQKCFCIFCNFSVSEHLKIACYRGWSHHGSLMSMSAKPAKTTWKVPLAGSQGALSCTPTGVTVLTNEYKSWEQHTRARSELTSTLRVFETQMFQSVGLFTRYWRT